jgi:hypothetical protein
MTGVFEFHDTALGQLLGREGGDRHRHFLQRLFALTRRDYDLGQIGGRGLREHWLCAAERCARCGDRQQGKPNRLCRRNSVFH